MYTFKKWRPSTYVVTRLAILLIIACNLFIVWHAFSHWSNHFYSGVITSLTPDTVIIRNQKNQEITVNLASTTPIYTGHLPSQLHIGMLIMIDGEKLSDRKIIARNIQIIDVRLPSSHQR